METRAWIALLALSAITTTLAVVQPALTVLAWLKARVILARYLGLAAAPDWLRGFNLVLALYAILLLALTLAA